MKKTTIILAVLIGIISIFNYIPVFKSYYLPAYGEIGSIILGILAAIGIDGAIIAVATYHTVIKQKVLSILFLTSAWISASFYHHEFYRLNKATGIILYLSSVLWPTLQLALSWISKSDETSEISDDDRLLNEILTSDVKASVKESETKNNIAKASDRQNGRANDKSKNETSERATKRATIKREMRVYPYTCDCGYVIKNRYAYGPHVSSCEVINAKKETIQ